MLGPNRYDRIKGDGKISYQEFISKLQNKPEQEIRTENRTSSKLLQVKELMILHMHTIEDAFNMVSTSPLIYLSFSFHKKRKDG